MGKSLVIGHRGYIGSALCNYLSDYIAPEKRINWMEDVTSDIDTIYLLACNTDAHGVEENPIGDLVGVVSSVLHLLRALRNRPKKPEIIFTSTSTIFGTGDGYPYHLDETYPDNPISIYDIHKLAIEKYLHHYRVQYGIPSVSLRLTNVYGPSPVEPPRGFVNRMAKNAAVGKDIEIYGGGSYFRDLLFIDDLIVTLGALRGNLSLLTESYYLMSSGYSTSIELIADLLSEFGSVNVIRKEPPRESMTIDHRSHRFKPSKLGRIVPGVPTLTNPISGLQRTFDYYRSRRDG